MQLEVHQIERRYAGLRIRDERRRAQLAASLLECGQRSPVLVVADEDGGYVLVDGHLRVEALVKLGRDLVEAVVLEMGEAEALILAHRLEAGRKRSALEEGWLIRELMHRHGLGQRAVAERLSRSVSWVSRRLALVHILPAAAQDAVRSGQVPSQGAMRCLVPLARANRGDCEKLLAGLKGRPVSVRELERLYRAWRKAAPAQRERILEAPAMYLKAEEAAERERLPEGDPAAPLVRDLEVVAGVCRRAHRRVREGVLSELGDRGRREVSHATAGARAAYEGLMVNLEGET